MDDVIKRIEGLEVMNRRIIASLVRIESKVHDLPTRGEFAQLESRMNIRMDGIAAQLDDLRFRRLEARRR